MRYILLSAVSTHMQSPPHSPQLQNAVIRHFSKMYSLKNALGFNISSCCCPRLLSLGKVILAVLKDLGRIPTDHCSFQSLFHELFLSKILPSYMAHKHSQSHACITGQKCYYGKSKSHMRPVSKKHITDFWHHY